MRALEKREKVMLAILGVAMLVLIWRVFGLTERITGPATQQRADVVMGEKQRLIAALPELVLDKAEILPAAYRPQRNLFDFTQCPEDLKRQQQRAAQEQARQKRLERQRAELQERRLQEARDRASLAERTPPRPAAPNPSFEYIGYFGELEDKIAVFEARGRDGGITIAKLGEVVDERFVLKVIEWDRVELGFTDPQFQSDPAKTLPMKGLEQ